MTGRAIHLKQAGGLSRVGEARFALVDKSLKPFKSE